MRRTAVLCGMVVAMGATSFAQRSSNWRVYKAADGLPESSCFAITTSAQGKVVVRHLNSSTVTELDGYELKVLPAPDGPPGGRVYESPGGQLWTVSPMGLYEFKAGAWVLHRLPEIADKFPNPGPRLNDAVPLCPVRQGLVIFLLPEGLFEFNSEMTGPAATQLLLSADQAHLGMFTGLALARDGGLWVAAERGFIKTQEPLRNLKPESPWNQLPLPGHFDAENLQQPRTDPQGGITAVAKSSTNHQTIIVHFDGQDWTTQAVADDRIRLAWYGQDSTIWEASGGALFESHSGQSRPAQNEEISPDKFYDVAIQPDGTFWLATSAGLFHHTPLLWGTPPSLREAASQVRCMESDEDARLWMVAGDELRCLDEDKCRTYAIPQAAPGASHDACRLFSLKPGILLAEDDQMLLFRPKTGEFIEATLGSATRRAKILGRLHDGRLLVETWNSSSSTNRELQAFDGAVFQPFPCPLPDSIVSDHFSVLFESRNGDLWLASDRATACYHDTKWRAFTSTDKTSPEAAACFCELPDGKIWCATRESIWEFEGQNWSEVRRGFDRINCLVPSRDGSIWVGSNSGLHRFCRGAWVENGPEDGLPGADVLQVLEDTRGHLWAATTLGVALFHAEADTDPPQTFIQELPESQKRIPEAGNLTIAFKGQDKWNYTPSARLLYSHRLDERDWSPFEETAHVTFSDLPPGKHYFQVRAMDRNCNVDPKPARLEFAVVLPWYKEARLMLVSAAGVGVALFFASVAFNRHRRLVRSYAEVEKRVAQRSEELDLANRQLLHSQKMNALGSLAAGIAHDFNNILSIIKGSAQIIETNLDDPEKVRTRVDRIKTVVEQGSGIVKAMLGFSRDSGQLPAPCDLNATVEDTVKLLGDRFLHEAQVSFDPGTDLPQVTCVKDFIQQILLNFIFNAAEAVDKQKRISLSSRPLDKLPAALYLAPAESATYVSVSVRDFGCGIPPQNLSRIFEPFYTTKALSTRRGAGLGLSMAYELAKKMGAGLAVESTVGQGSTFTLILPVSAVDATDNVEMKIENCNSPATP